ncbi:MAG: hypothetical protein EBV06_13655 [Planctomycetia bacterium]|nr:hypothetical protein [Planctomycetia bacterium]
MSDNDIVCLATTSDRSEAYEWRLALEAAGIECQMGEDLTVYVNNVPWSQADLWVHRANVERALAVLERQPASQIS